MRKLSGVTQTLSAGGCLPFALAVGQEGELGMSVSPSVSLPSYLMNWIYLLLVWTVWYGEGCSFPCELLWQMKNHLEETIFHLGRVPPRYRTW